MRLERHYNLQPQALYRGGIRYGSRAACFDKRGNGAVEEERAVTHKETYEQELEAALIIRDRISERLQNLFEIKRINRQRIAELRLKIAESKTENKPVNS